MAVSQRAGSFLKPMTPQFKRLIGAAFTDTRKLQAIRSVSEANCPLIEAITPLIITFDEAHNISRTLDKLAWARRIVVVDSGSTDGTLDILGRYPQVALFKRAFDTFADQCNF